MKIYIDEAEIGSTISYTEEYGKKQNLYVHDKEGFVFKSLKEKLAEKDKEIALLEEQDGQYHNQLAIECLKEVKEKINKDIIIAEDYFEIIDIIDNKMKELEGK